MTNCALLAFPSIREFGGGVVLEAMALGITPLIVDYAGPSELVKDGLGYKVPLGSREKIIAGFRQQLTQIVAAPEQLPKIGKAARQHILKHFTWDRKALQMIEVYNRVLGEQNKEHGM
jgi:glycosyltransferase involved in cell wall biosynthesis